CSSSASKPRSCAYPPAASSFASDQLAISVVPEFIVKRGRWVNDRPNDSTGSVQGKARKAVVKAKKRGAPISASTAKNRIEYRGRLFLDGFYVRSQLRDSRVRFVRGLELCKRRRGIGR